MIMEDIGQNMGYIGGHMADMSLLCCLCPMSLCLFVCPLLCLTMSPPMSPCQETGGEIRGIGGEWQTQVSPMPHTGGDMEGDT